MALVAKAQKTITALEDGYSIVATPSNIVIPSNSDGSGSILTGAKARVLLQNSKGVSLPVTITSVVGTGCTASYTGNEVAITGVSADNGNLAITFSSTGGYVGTVNVPFAKLKQGESTYNVLLSNEVHTIPALFDGRVEQNAIDQARSKIAVLKGATPLTAVAANATPGIGQFRYNIDSVIGGTAGRVDNSTFKLSTMTASNCIIKIKVYIENLTRVIEKEMVITKVIGADPTDFEQLKSIFDSWRFADSVEIDGSKLKAGTITADKIVAYDLLVRQLATSDLPNKLTINEDGDNSIKFRNSKTGLVNAGVSGLTDKDEESLRFWAGSGDSDKYNAPFKVLANGALEATKGKIGNFTINTNKLSIGSENSWTPNSQTIALYQEYFLMRDNGAIGGQRRELSWNLYKNVMGSSISAATSVFNTMNTKTNSTINPSTNIGLEIEASGGDKNYALSIVSGGINVYGSAAITEEVPFVAGWSGSTAYWRNLIVKSGLIVGVGPIYYR